MMRRFKTKTEFRRLLRANARSKLLKLQRGGRSNEARSARAAMRAAWLCHARLMRFMQFNDRIQAMHIKALPCEKDDYFAKLLADFNRTVASDLQPGVAQ